MFGWPIGVELVEFWVSLSSGIGLYNILGGLSGTLPDGRDQEVGGGIIVTIKLKDREKVLDPIYTKE